MDKQRLVILELSRGFSSEDELEETLEAIGNSVTFPEANTAKLLSIDEHEAIASALNFSFIKTNTSMLTMSDPFDSKQALQDLKTRFGYVQSDSQLYFLDKTTGICRQSMISTDCRQVKESFCTAKPRNRLTDTQIHSDCPLSTTPLSPLAQEVICANAIRLTDLMDSVIKTTKGSPSYIDRKQLLATRFIQSLKPYRNLMRE